ncbi:hypothetical protein TSMEX_002973 [Taenia solium]|eukprot:TsM_000035400 transcript=TsM_000035400 gene=TsM_000035400
MLIGTNPYFSQRMTPYVPKQKKVTKKLRTTTSKPSNKKPDSVRAIDSNATQLIISTLPSIPIHYANGLLNAAPSFVQYILKKHQNLHGLLANMDNKTLLYVTAHVPEFGKILSKKEPDTLKVVFDKLLSISDYFIPLEKSTLVPKKNEKVTKGAPITVATEVPIVTDKELKMTKSKIPLIGCALKWMDPQKLAALRELVPEIPKIWADLGAPNLETVHSHLSNVTQILNEVQDVLVKGAPSKLK